MEKILSKNSMQIMQGLQDWFGAYADKYIKEYGKDQEGNNGYYLKKEHSANVLKNMEMLGESIGLNEREMLLANAIAILHDVGRFEQLHRSALSGKPSFSDKLIDHARLGAEIVQESNALKDFTELEKSIAYKAISNHSMYKLPEGLSQKEEMFCKLIRDADKLDILKVDIENYEKQKGNPLLYKDTAGISDEAFASFMMHKSLSKAATGDEVTLLRLAFIFDLNFKKSFDVLIKNRYIEKLADRIQDEKKGIIKKEAEEYANKKLLQNLIRG
ncbi:MAG: HD domain-containing protein [Candidatus Micrarchaeaceae archaeon]